MRKIAILLGVIVPLMGICQEESGIITYEIKINMHRRIPDDRAEMKNMIPEFNVLRAELLYTQEASMFRPIVEDVEAEPGPGGGFRMMMQRMSSQVYKNFSTQKLVEKRDFMGKNYLIADTIRQFSWKIIPEPRQIAGYNCMKAVRQDTAARQKITVWFTPEIAVSSGPERMGTLPGMILAADINNGETTMTAMTVEKKAIPLEDIQEPKKGKYVTQEEFRKMMMDYRREMGGQGGGFGGPRPNNN